MGSLITWSSTLRDDDKCRLRSGFQSVNSVAWTHQDWQSQVDR